MKNLVNPEKMFKILQNVDSKKATQQCDMPVRIMQETKFTFSKMFLKCLTFTLTITLFLMDLRRLILSLCTRKDSSDKTNYRPIYLFYQKLLSAACMIIFMNTLILYYQRFNVQFSFRKYRNKRKGSFQLVFYE